MVDRQSENAPTRRHIVIQNVGNDLRRTDRQPEYPAHIAPIEPSFSAIALTDGIAPDSTCASQRNARPSETARQDPVPMFRAVSAVLTVPEHLAELERLANVALALHRPQP